MIIHISKSDLFTKDPDIRFANQYNLPRGFWNFMFNRAKHLEYTVQELCELYRIKTGKEMPDFSMRRWLWRTEIYNLAFPFIKKGAQTVVSEVFGEYEDELIKELTKHMRDGATKNSNILI